MLLLNKKQGKIQTKVSTQKADFTNIMNPIGISQAPLQSPFVQYHSQVNGLGRGQAYPSNWLRDNGRTIEDCDSNFCEESECDTQQLNLRPRKLNNQDVNQSKIEFPQQQEQREQDMPFKKITLPKKERISCQKSGSSSTQLQHQVDVNIQRMINNKQAPIKTLYEKQKNERIESTYSTTNIKSQRRALVHPKIAPIAITTPISPQSSIISLHSTNQQSGSNLSSLNTSLKLSLVDLAPHQLFTSKMSVTNQRQLKKGLESVVLNQIAQQQVSISRKQSSIIKQNVDRSQLMLSSESQQDPKISNDSPNDRQEQSDFLEQPIVIKKRSVRQYESPARRSGEGIIPQSPSKRARSMEKIIFTEDKRSKTRKDSIDREVPPIKTERPRSMLAETIPMILQFNQVLNDTQSNRQHKSNRKPMDSRESVTSRKTDQSKVQQFYFESGDQTQCESTRPSLGLQDLNKDQITLNTNVATTNLYHRRKNTLDEQIQFTPMVIERHTPSTRKVSQRRIFLAKNNSFLSKVGISTKQDSNKKIKLLKVKQTSPQDQDRVFSRESVLPQLPQQVVQPNCVINFNISFGCFPKIETYNQYKAGSNQIAGNQQFYQKPQQQSDVNSYSSSFNINQDIFNSQMPTNDSSESFMEIPGQSDLVISARDVRSQQQKQQSQIKLNLERVQLSGSQRIADTQFDEMRRNLKTPSFNQMGQKPQNSWGMQMLKNEKVQQNWQGVPLNRKVFENDYCLD